MHLAHHDLYEKAGILHRDISINNLMVDPSDRSRGILIDLDMAARDKDPDSGLKLELPPLPGGTVPFRAADLCDHDPLPRTLYRHDLDSCPYGWLCIAPTDPSIHISADGLLVPGTRFVITRRDS